jgi:hypothetical protein
MSDITGAQILPFPVQPRIVNRAARNAVTQLLYHSLIGEREAVRVLTELEATDEEIDLIRGVVAVVARRV